LAKRPLFLVIVCGREGCQSVHALVLGYLCLGRRMGLGTGTFRGAGREKARRKISDVQNLGGGGAGVVVVVVVVVVVRG